MSGPRYSRDAEADGWAQYDREEPDGVAAATAGAKRRTELGERFDALRALFPSDDGWGDASRYTDGGE